MNIHCEFSSDSGGSLADQITLSLATTSNEKPKLKRINPVVDDGASLLDDSLAALTSYNELLEEKVAKLGIQADRSLATLRESSISDYDTTRLDDAIAATKRRRFALEKEVCTLC